VALLVCDDVLCIGSRSKLSIIPQDPFLFSGTVRDNIDPQHLRSDMEISNAVQQCRLGQTVDRLGGLDGVITEGGRILSAGERQLVCLARALLSQTQVPMNSLVFLVLFSITKLHFCLFLLLTGYHNIRKLF